MRLPRLFATSSFRLTMLYAALFVVSVSILVGVVFWSALHSMARQIDVTVQEEMAEVRASAPPGDIAGLRREIAGLARTDSDFRYLLQDTQGRVIAGNMPATVAIGGKRTLPGPTEGKHPGSIRGLGIVMPGGYLFVGTNDHALREMRIAVERAFLLGLMVTILLALAGGGVMSLGVLRRVEAIGRASHDIMAGDLSRRVPLRGSKDEFDQLATGFNAMLDRIQALMAGLQQVSSNIAHDLRTPLTRVRHRLELGRRRANSVEALHAALDRSIDDVDAILRTFGALLRIAQVEAGTRRAGFADLDLAPMLAGLVETYQPVAEERGQTLAARVAGPIMVHGDHELIVQMFVNLIENAIRHTPPGTRIVVSGSIAGIAVEDNGPGIPADLRTHVLQRFTRLESSQDTPGEGLGLSMVSAVAQLHDASLILQDAAPGLRVEVHFVSW